MLTPNFMRGNCPIKDLILLLNATAFVLIMISALLSSALQAIFSVALFHFTTGEGGYGPFTPEELNGVLTKK